MRLMLEFIPKQFSPLKKLVFELYSLKSGDFVSRFDKYFLFPISNSSDLLSSLLECLLTLKTSGKSSFREEFLDIFASIHNSKKPDLAMTHASLLFESTFLKFLFIFAAWHKISSAMIWTLFLFKWQLEIFFSYFNSWIHSFYRK